MHPARPPCHHTDGQVKDECQSSSISLPHPLDPSAHESVQIEETVASPPRSAADELASPGSSFLPVAADAQPLFTMQIDSRDVEVTTAVTTVKDHRIFCAGDQDNDVSPGHATASTDDQIGLRGVSSSLDGLPNEILLHVLGFLDVSDVLATSRTNHLLRQVSLSPILHRYRLRRTREILPPLLWSPSRPSVADLTARSIFRTHTSVVSRRLAWSLVSIRLSRRLASRPPVEDLVVRSVLPRECVPGLTPVHVSPGLVAKRKAIEKEKVKDGLRRWIGGKWKREVRVREQELRRWYETRGVGRVWKLTRFWEQMSRGDGSLPR
ncbi:hypothetical protein E4U43_008584 [Claviceps pusilla]|uniref:F-box domain-containing protein n=1 Tax=Claviceps pusilla TaxID=123648 RepID=A0A9P7NCY5_9HYPO|nr:hypothetical protein E4U43_008584 [Claviceps pusilla]